MADKTLAPVTPIPDAAAPSRAMRALNAVRAFGRRIFHGGPDLYPIVSRLHCAEHRADKVSLMMRGMLQADPRLTCVELWEAKEEGLRLSLREGGAPVSTKPGEREFIRFEDDLRASKARDGFVVLFNGRRTRLLNSQPDSYAVEDEFRGITFGVDGCFVPLGTLAGNRMETTHVLAVYGHIKPRVSRRNRQLHSVVSAARLIGDQIYSQGIAQRAETDWLTGLYNLRFLEQRLLEEAIYSIVLRRPVSIAFIDLDRFKDLNDSLGHPIGNQVLSELGSALRSRGSGLPARFGGEEFIVMEFGLSPEIAVEKALDLHRFFSPLACRSDAGAIQVRASIGVFSSFIWDRLRKVDALALGCSGMSEKDAIKMRSMAEEVLRLVGEMRALRQEADAEIRKLREFESVARKYGSLHELEAMLRQVSGPLRAYAGKWRELMVRIADAAMYFVKSTGRDGIAAPVIDGNVLSFERLKFRGPEPSAPSIIEGDPPQLSPQGPQSSPPSPSEGPHQ
ncbi:MAG: GGDEF domain-containing protein [Candidatus Micrarchaeota archaeon]